MCVIPAPEHNAIAMTVQRHSVWYMTYNDGVPCNADVLSNASQRPIYYIRDALQEAPAHTELPTSHNMPTERRVRVRVSASAGRSGPVTSGRQRSPSPTLDMPRPRPRPRPLVLRTYGRRSHLGRRHNFDGSSAIEISSESDLERQVEVLQEQVDVVQTTTTTTTETVETKESPNESVTHLETLIENYRVNVSPDRISDPLNDLDIVQTAAGLNKKVKDIVECGICWNWCWEPYML